VLIVDDDRSVLVTMEAILDEHYDVVATTDANVALARIDGDSFDIVCVDYVMPGTTGLELLEHVAAQPEFTARILISGHREHQDRWQRTWGELYYVLLKPFAPEELLDLFARAMAQTTLRRRFTARKARRTTLPETSPESTSRDDASSTGRGR
jgi:two-component system response regulator HupR/HoxA